MTEAAPSQEGRPLFPLGETVATPSALAALDIAGVTPETLLACHERGDWGDLSDHDRQMNDRALPSGGRLLSAYRLPDGTRVWIVTEADRSATTLLLPDDY